MLRRWLGWFARRLRTLLARQRMLRGMNMALEKPSPHDDTSQPTVHTRLSSAARRCRRKFLRFFPRGFHDEKYVDWERGYKWQAHEQWNEMLDRRVHKALLQENGFSENAARAVRIESRTNLLFSLYGENEGRCAALR